MRGGVLSGIDIVFIYLFTCLKLEEERCVDLGVCYYVACGFFIILY